MKSFVQSSLTALKHVRFTDILGVAALVGFALMMPYAFGLTFGGHHLKELWDWKNVVFIFLTFFTMSRWRLTRWLIAVPAVIFLAAYLPTGIVYGKPNVMVTIAALQTTPEESLEFIATTPWKLWSKAVLLLILGIIGLHFTARIKGSRYLPLFTGVAAVAIAFSAMHWHIGNIEKVQLFSFLNSLKASVTEAATELHAEANAEPPTWEITGVDPKYKNFVVIIGESQRRDYASVFGYPLETTPFLNMAKGVFFSNFVAPGPNTMLSLPRLLSLNTQGSDEYSRGNNIVTLANQAGFDSWWISNQGRIGLYDNAVSQIGVRSRHTFWLKKGGYTDSNKDDDRLLLPQIERALQSPLSENSHHRIIFVHLMGSHPLFCSRLSGRAPAFKVGDEEMDCYLTTYRMADAFIERTVSMLKQSGEPWSLVYLSDHGLAMRTMPGPEHEKKLRHGIEYRQNYEVPFLKISSDSTAHEVNPSYRSGLRTIQGLAEWIGVSVKNPGMNVGPDFWGQVNDPKVRLFDGRLYNDLKDDPAIVFRNTSGKNTDQYEKKL